MWRSRGHVITWQRAAIIFKAEISREAYLAGYGQEIFLFSNKNNPSKEGAKIHRAPVELDLYRVLEKICTIGKKISLSEQISN